MSAVSYLILGLRSRTDFRNVLDRRWGSRSVIREKSEDTCGSGNGRGQKVRTVRRVNVQTTETRREVDEMRIYEDQSKVYVKGVPFKRV